ncbi:hypothetical protein [Azospirillum sp. B506]|nr:hypothetical protein [Azospirillum sp. B506]
MYGLAFFVGRTIALPVWITPSVGQTQFFVIAGPVEVSFAAMSGEIG